MVGWLVKTSRPDGEVVILLMAVVQEKKNKVRPVLDLRELNQFVECSEVDADACDEKLRSWRQKSEKLCVTGLTRCLHANRHRRRVQQVSDCQI